MASKNLSEIEIKILELLSKSKTNAEIAKALTIRLDEICQYVNFILFKLNSQSKTEAVIKAIKYSIIKCDRLFLVEQGCQETTWLRL